ncbi:MAG: hypothetical protein GY801_45575 [bacterium]|nr:hypothetical protein [bacterium]
MNDRQYVYRYILAVIATVCLFTGPASSQLLAQEKNPCDPGLPGALKDPLSYQVRGDRCEGRYAVNSQFWIFSGVLRVVSFVESFEEYALGSGQDLLVEWSLPQPKEVSLRADALQAELYYRMDATPPANVTRYHWSTDILQALSISRNELGVIGWASYKFSNGMVEEVYLPLRITQSPPTKASSSYRIVIWPTQELNEVFVSVATLGSDGSPKNFILDGKALGYGYYPKERGIHFDIPKPEKPGIYYLQIGATFGKGGVVNIEHWFYHAG